MRIILIGFMGSGKTVVGRRLSKKLNLQFIDIDEEIEKKSNASIENIFEEYGEGYFRELESKLLEKVLKVEDIVISTGGGIVKENVNYELLKKEKDVIFLDANEQTIINNVSYDINKRPLLKNSSNLYETIHNLLVQRYEKYKDVANVHLDVNNKNVEEVVSQILVSTR